jgi:preprotein translocase subunit SecG
MFTLFSVVNILFFAAVNILFFLLLSSSSGGGGVGGISGNSIGSRRWRGGMIRNSSRKPSQI